jgi:hypothetical protein
MNGNFTVLAGLGSRAGPRNDVKPVPIKVNIGMEQMLHFTDPQAGHGQHSELNRPRLKRLSQHQIHLVR